MAKTSLIVAVQLFLFFIYELQVVRTQDFGYSGDKGPSHWGEQYNTCKGKHQSPINIKTVDLLYVSMPPLKMVGFKTPPQETSLTNNGHTVQVKMDSEVQPQISGGPLHGIYEFSQFHFHWGDNDTFGSEGTIDNHSFPMAIHLVFYKKNYRSARDALDYPDGLTVLSLYYVVAEEDNPAYAEFTDILGHISRSDQSASFKTPPTIYDLIATDFSRFHSYNGSLTTPPCSEVVTWIDFEEPIRLSRAQIAMFRSLRDPEGNKLTHNFRPIQPLNNRIVLANSQHADEPGYAPIFLDETPPTDPPPTTAQSTNIMDLTSTEQETTIHYEVTDWSTTIKFVPAPAQPIQTTTSTREPEEVTQPSTKSGLMPVQPLITIGGTEAATTTLGKVIFPEQATDAPAAVAEDVAVVTHRTHKLDRGRGKGSGQAGVTVHPILSLVPVAITTLTILITTNFLV